MRVCEKIAGKTGLKSICAKLSIEISHQTFSCSKSTIEPLEKVVKYVQLTITIPERGQRYHFSVFFVNSAHFS